MWAGLFFGTVGCIVLALIARELRRGVDILDDIAGIIEGWDK